ncbi:hypothetical protein KK141_15245 [Dyella sp. LX-66]|uniref:hypothetical protein n=1 Tax=unclassified Dyella TaxID=2634549 RepID=UPI001BDFF1E3|nr:MULTISPECIES: hypothetical protein [unclassified Dyella]MBT2117995.1 hypothetical protein [Dyella sp. LX-1]MBT2140902.1 hypothetical protein [Dyella sp. LX-66]
MLRSWLLLGVALALAGCSGVRDGGTERRLEHDRAVARSHIDEAACRDQGGSVKGVGMLGMPACVVPFADGGKPCKDKADCQGRCLIAASATDEVTPRTATCQRDNQLFGCWSEVLHGQAQPGLCVD